MRAALVDVALTCATLIALASCASTEEGASGAAPSAPGALWSVDEDASHGAPVLVWEVRSSPGEIDYVLVREPPVGSLVELAPAYLDAIANADRANVLNPNGTATSLAGTVMRSQMPEGRSLRDVISPETEARLDAWIAANGFGARARILDALHPATVGATVWLMEATKAGGQPEESGEARLRRLLPRVPRDIEGWPVDDAGALFSRIGELPLAFGVGLLERALDENAVASTAAVEGEIRAAFEAADLEALERAYATAGESHPLFMLAFAAAEEDNAGTAARCAALLDNGTRDAALIEPLGQGGARTCLEALRTAGASLKMLRARSVVDTSRTAALKAETLPVREVLVKRLPEGPVTTVKAKTPVRAPKGFSFRVDGHKPGRATAVLRVPRAPAATSPDPAGDAVVVFDLERGKELARLSAPALNYSLPQGARELAVAMLEDRTGYVLVDTTTGERRELRVKASDGRALYVVGIDGLEDGRAVVRAAEGQLDAEGRLRLEQAEAFFAVSDLEGGTVEVDVGKPLRHLQGTYAEGEPLGDDGLVFLRRLSGVRPSPRDDAPCAAYAFTVDEGSRCVSWDVDVGRRWRMATNGMWLESRKEGFQQETLGVELPDDALLPTPGCEGFVRERSGNATFGLNCQDGVRVLGAGKAYRLQSAEAGRPRLFTAVGSDLYLFINPTGASPGSGLIDARAREAMAFPGAVSVLTPPVEGKLLLSDPAAQKLYLFDRAERSALELGWSLCSPREGQVTLVETSAQRVVIGCAQRGGGAKADPGAVLVIDPRTGAVARVPGVFFAMTPRRLIVDDPRYERGKAVAHRLRAVALEKLPGFAQAE